MHSMQMTIKETETNLVSSSPEYPTSFSHIISVSSCYLRSLTSIYLQHFSCLKLLNKLVQIVQRKQAPPRTLLVTSHRTQHSHLCRSTTSAAAHNCTYTFPRTQRMHPVWRWMDFFTFPGLQREHAWPQGSVLLFPSLSEWGRWTNPMQGRQELVTAASSR